MARPQMTAMIAEPVSFRNRSQDWRWAGIFLLVSVLLGLGLMVIPAYWTMAAIIGLVALGYLALNPDKVFYLAVFTIPFTDRVRVLPISFSLNELVILYCAVVCFLHMVLRRQWVSIRTGLDGWLIVLTFMFFLAGYFSESNSGLLGFFKIFEGIIIYYLAVWLIRTRQITRATAIKALLITTLSQALLGIFQSFTGIGANFHSNRGYLGYLGLGSSGVWHGRGTTWHFNTLGNFLATNLLIFMPLYLYIIKRKKWGLFLGGIIMLGLITTYSRGSLLGLTSGVIFFLAAIQSDWRRALLFVCAFFILLMPVVLFFGNSSYVETVSFNDRLYIWQVPIAAITSSDKAFWLGSGLNSYDVVAWPYIPAWVPPEQFHNWFAHNFYLLTVVEVGLIGAIIFFSFLGWLWFDTWRKYKKWHGFMSVYSLSISVALVTVFFVSIFDHTFAAPHFKVFLFLILGLLYVKRSSNRRRLKAGA
jgi:hypothetical protein